MTLADTMHAAIDQIAAAGADGLELLNRMTGETFAVFIIGVIAAAVSLGCLLAGLIGDWKGWAETHKHKRSRD